MKNQLKFVSIGIALVACGVVSAQVTGTTTTTATKMGKSGHHGVAKEMALLNQLNLSPTQMSTIKAAMKTHQEAMKELKASEKTSKDSPDVVKEKHKAITKAFHDTLKTTLTPVQMLKLKALLKAEKAKATAAKETTPPAPTP